MATTLPGTTATEARGRRGSEESGVAHDNRGGCSDDAVGDHNCGCAIATLYSIRAERTSTPRRIGQGDRSTSGRPSRQLAVPSEAGFGKDFFPFTNSYY